MNITIFFTETNFNEELQKYSLELINKLSKYKDIILINKNIQRKCIQAEKAIETYNITKNFNSEQNKILDKINQEYKIENLVFLENKSINEIDEKYLQKNNILKTLILDKLYISLIDKVTKQEDFDFESFYYDVPRLANLEWNAIRKTDKIICLSNYIKKELSNHYEEEIKDKEVKIIKTGLNKEEYKPTISKNNIWLLKSKLNFEDGITYLLKNSFSTNNTGGFIIGYGSYKYDIKEKIKEQDIVQYNVVDQETYMELLKEVQFCLFPSVYEPWGFALNEAMAMGKVVIVQSGESGLTEQVEDGVNGFHFDFKEKNVFEYIEELKQEKLDEIAISASKSVEEIEKTTKKIKEVLR